MEVNDTGKLVKMFNEFEVCNPGIPEVFQSRESMLIVHYTFHGLRIIQSTYVTPEETNLGPEEYIVAIFTVRHRNK